MSETRKIVVVGSGPAGLAFALDMSKKGHDITVVERFSDVETSFCGEYYNPRMAPYADLFEDCIRSRTKVIRAIFIDDEYRSLSEKSIQVDYALVDSGCMKRKMMEAARKEGVEFVFNTMVTGIDRAASGYLLHSVSNGRKMDIKADIVVGSDGYNSVVRRTLLPEAKIRALPSIRKIYYVSGYPEGEFRFYLGGPYKFGYGWVYPGEETDRGILTNIGVGFIEDYVNRSTTEMLEEFVSYLRSTGLRIEEAPRKGVIGNMIPFSGIVNPAGAVGVLLVGDALGAVNAVVGGGVVNAMYSGVLAADYMDFKLSVGEMDFSDWRDWVVDMPWGTSVENSAKMIRIAETIYGRNPNLFNLLAEALNAVDDDLLFALSQASVRKRDLMAFAARHPALTAKILATVRPLKLKKEIRTLSYAIGQSVQGDGVSEGVNLWTH